FGSPSYCSPERLGRSAVDAQADLWAVAVTLYEMAAGVPPYQAEDTRKLERLIQSRRPPRALPPTCPPSLKAIVHKALAPDPSRGHGSAEAFNDDLEAFLEGRPTTAEHEKRGPWRGSPTLDVQARATRAKKVLAEKLARQAPRLRRLLPGALRAAAVLAC